jgi:hypothetical protein
MHFFRENRPVKNYAIVYAHGGFWWFYLPDLPFIVYEPGLSCFTFIFTY